MSVRPAIRRAIDRAADAVGLLARLERNMSRGVTILTYHRVLPNDLIAGWPLPGLCTPTPLFIETVEWLAARYRLLTVSAALAAIERGEVGREGGRPIVCLTFDDGYTDNATIAAPILERHGARGTFFVVAGAAGTDRRLWFDAAARAWASAARGMVARASSPRSGVEPQTMPEWLAHLKSLPDARRQAILDDAIRPDDWLASDPLDAIMPPARIVELHRAGHEIGSHTMTHPILTRVEDAVALRRELAESRRLLEEWTGAPVPGLCYPNGDADERVIEAARSAGYTYACTTEPGRNGAATGRFRLMRLDMNPRRLASTSGGLDAVSLRAEIGLLHRGLDRARRAAPIGVPRALDARAADAATPPIRVAYLNSQYPKVSHTFIEREVRALRELGVEITTFSIRPPAAADLLSDANRAAADETCYLLGDRSSRAGLAAGAGLIAGAAGVSPLALGRALRRSQRLARAGVKRRALHVAYVFEAARLVREMRRRGLSHVHVHMANNGAAVAMLACTLDPRLTWSLSIHGSAEFFDVHGVNLREKAESALFVRCISGFCRAQVMAWTSPDAWPRFRVVHCGVDARRFARLPPVGRGSERPTGVADEGRTAGGMAVALDSHAEGGGQVRGHGCAEPQPCHTDVRDSSGAPREPLRLMTVGRLEPIKGYPLLLEACERLTVAGVDWRLEMVGDGPIRTRLEEQSRRPALAGRVTFRGAMGQDAVRSLYADCDALVVSSFMEGVPVVLMEAMAMGLAVVSTAVGGVPELVEDGVSGLLVRPGSADSIAEAMLRLARTREHDGLAEMGRAGRRKIVADYSIERTARGMAALFEEFLGGHPSQREVPGVGSPRADLIGASR